MSNHENLSGWLDRSPAEEALARRHADDRARYGDAADDPYYDWMTSTSPPSNVGAEVVALADVTPERVRWLWPGRLPRGKLVLLDGDPSVGKSTLALDLAARLSVGSTWPDGTPVDAAGDTLVMSAEDGLADTIAPRLLAAGADLGRVHALTAVDVTDEDGKVRRAPPSIPRDVPLLDRIITSRSVGLLVVDVLMAYLAGSVNSYRDQDVRAVMHQLADMAGRTGCTVLLVRHLNKSGGGHALYRGGGSIGIIGAARAGFLVACDPEDETGERRVLAAVKSNLAAEPSALAYRLVGDPATGAARVEWEDAPTGHKASDLLAVPVGDDERTEQDEAQRWLTEFLTERGGTAGAGEVLKAAGRDGIGKVTLHRARKRAGIETSKAGMGGGWTWTLPGTAAEDFTKVSKVSGSGELKPSETFGGSVKPSGADGTRPCAICAEPFRLEVPSRIVCPRCRPHLLGRREENL